MSERTPEETLEYMIDDHKQKLVAYAEGAIEWRDLGFSARMSFPALGLTTDGGWMTPHGSDVVSLVKSKV